MDLKIPILLCLSIFLFSCEKIEKVSPIKNIQNTKETTEKIKIDKHTT